jgi:hypothetical protein
LFSRLVGQLAQQGGLEGAQKRLDLRQQGQGVAQSGQVARASAPQGDTGEDALDVADPRQQAAEVFQLVPSGEFLDGVVAGGEGGAVARGGG